VRAGGRAARRLGADAWPHLDRLIASGEFWELLHDSPFARQTPLLDPFARIGLARSRSLAAVRRDVRDHARFADPRSTRVDSPIDEAPRHDAASPDFAHVMIALVRQLDPCATCGYLFQQSDHEVRSTDGATTPGPRRSCGLG
jgi:hypothetical protein